MSGQFADDIRVDQAKAMDIATVVDALGLVGLKNNGEWISGPCFNCGDHSKPESDRFNINTRDGGFFCRKQCGVKGGDLIALVMKFRECSFPEALTWLCGERDQSLDPAIVEKRRREATRSRENREASARRERARARDQARAIWNSSLHPLKTDTVVSQYLEIRGLTAERLPVLPRSLRYLPNHQYARKIGGKLRTLHIGPCLVAAIQDPAGVGCGVHQTFIDLDQPKGKAQIFYEGAPQSAKLMRGTSRTGAVRLATPDGATALVMGEGIETTLTALAFNVVPGAAYWAACSLGNMGGKFAKGEDGKFMKGVPDMADDRCFVPPPWCKHLIYLGEDMDADGSATELKLRAGLTRAKALRPEIEVSWVKIGANTDLNDFAMKGHGNDANQDV